MGVIELKPQPGPQEQFLSTSADIALYGGAAGGGKTYALLLEQLRNINNPDFGSVIFRRTSGQIFNEGGLWDEAQKVYLPLGVRAVQSPRAAIMFKTGAKITFTHLQFEKDKFTWQGSQIPLICFDELTHFSKGQFFYMMSRNRSTCGVKPYIRATTNPDADSWVADFIKWYWNPDTGYAIPERSGVVRYFVSMNNDIIWGDSKEELVENYPQVTIEQIKSFTFISSKLSDNKILMTKDPTYLANLSALPQVDKERLLNGNWKIRPSAGAYFKMEQFTIVDTIPINIIAYARAWDLAATEPNPLDNDPDATAGVLMGLLEDGRVIVLDVKRKQIKANDVRNLLRNVAVLDQGKYRFVEITIPQDPGQAGKAQAQSLCNLLSGFSVEVIVPSGSKEVRATPYASQVQAGNVLVLRADWNNMYFAELESFPESRHDDMVDASSDAFNKLQRAKNWKGLLG